MNKKDIAGLRRLTADDFGNVVAIDSHILGRSRRLFYQKRLEAALADERGFIATAVDGPGGALAGYAIARIQNGEFGTNRRVAVLDIIGVDPEARRQGAGRKLIEGIEVCLRKWQIEELRTELDWHDSAMMQFFAAAGFDLAPVIALECPVAGDTEIPSGPGAAQNALAAKELSGIARQKMDAGIPDYSDSAGDDFEALSRDEIPVRSMREDDLNTVVHIDAKLTGRARHEYFETKLKEMMVESGVRISLVAEKEDRQAGFIMARLDYGEFGRTEAAAVIDTLGVEPSFTHKGVASALMSQLLANLNALKVESVQTRVIWNNFPLLGFLASRGFKPAQRLSLTKTL